MRLRVIGHAFRPREELVQVGKYYHHRHDRWRCGFVTRYQTSTLHNDDYCDLPPEAHDAAYPSLLEPFNVFPVHRVPF
jgi:hypothetical protein